jgi:hypothetical protein
MTGHIWWIYKLYDHNLPELFCWLLGQFSILYAPKGSQHVFTHYYAYVLSCPSAILVFCIFAYIYRQPIYADVIFIHGLLGGPFRTWRQNDCMRPKKTSNNSQSVTSSREKHTTSSLDASNPESVIVEHLPIKSVFSSPHYNNVRANNEEDPAPYTMCWPQVC